MERKCGLIRSPPDPRDRNARNYLTRSVPVEAFDLRSSSLRVKDQGDTSTCAAQSCSTMKEWQEMQTGEGKNSTSIKEALSPLFVYNNREDPNIDGMYLRNAMQILSAKGICYEDTYPLYSPLSITQKMNEEALNFIIKGYAIINDVETMKKSLYENGPCLVALPVYNYGPKFWIQNAGETFKGGHCVTAVGYNKDNIVLQNSWGTDWGINGYTYFPILEFETIWEIWTSVDQVTPVPPPPQPCCASCVIL